MNSLTLAVLLVAFADLTPGNVLEFKNIKIVQTIDDDNCLGRPVGYEDLVWFQMNTTNTADDDIIAPQPSYFIYAGTKRYGTAIGASNTVRVFTQTTSEQAITILNKLIDKENQKRLTAFHAAAKTWKLEDGTEILGIFPSSGAAKYNKGSGGKDIIIRLEDNTEKTITLFADEDKTYVRKMISEQREAARKAASKKTTSSKRTKS